MLEPLGVSARAESVYLAMLHDPNAGVAEIATELDTDESDVRAALNELARISLVRESPEASEAIQPVSPQLGLAALVARVRAELARRHHEVEASRVEIDQLINSYAERVADAADLRFTQLTSIDDIRKKLRELASTCVWEACSFMPGGAQSEASLAASRPLDEEAIARGVRLRTIFLESARNDPATHSYALWLGELGSEVRTAVSLPLRMLVVDRKTAVVPLDQEDSRAGAVVVSGAGVVSGLMALFNKVWHESRPIVSRRPPRSPAGLSPQNKQILVLLSTGHTDEAIARQLGISVRTVRRVASGLFQRLGARSRFQAGAIAVAQGWLSLDDLE